LKVLTVIVFIIIGILVATGALGGHVYGFENYELGAFQGMGVFSTFLLAAFSFQGSELIGVIAGETENPRKMVPRAIKQVFWRILLFYICSLFIIGLIIPYNDPSLLSASVSNVATSPFTLVFQKAGLAGAAGKYHLMKSILYMESYSGMN
jgi:lysine-specific permease